MANCRAVHVRLLCIPVCGPMLAFVGFFILQTHASTVVMVAAWPLMPNDVHVLVLTPTLACICKTPSK